MCLASNIQRFSTVLVGCHMMHEYDPNIVGAPIQYSTHTVHTYSTHTLQCIQYMEIQRVNTYSTPIYAVHALQTVRTDTYSIYIHIYSQYIRFSYGKHSTYITPHHITSPHLTSHRITSHQHHIWDTPGHHNTSHHIALHCTTLHYAHSTTRHDMT